MSRKIKLSEQDIEEMCNQFKQNLLGIRFDAEKITYTANTKINNSKKVKVFFRPEAYCKMTTLIKSCDKEIAWHGVVDKTEDGNYIIQEIMMYPQEITGATVTSNDAKYPMWLMSQPDEIFNRLRFQGHSHVNFGATPSSVDTTLYNNMLQTLDENDFYIFFIMNKRAEFWIQIYNLGENTVYEKEDIELAILLSDNTTMDTWYDEQTKENIIENKPTATKTTYVTNNYSKYTDKTWRWDYTRRCYVPTSATEAQIKRCFTKAKKQAGNKDSYEFEATKELETLHDELVALDNDIDELEEMARAQMLDDDLIKKDKLDYLKGQRNLLDHYRYE